MSLILFLICLGFLIFIHELGHYLVAKACNVAVYEFAIGFGPAVYQKTIGETKYTLRGIPLGGYVKMAGEDLFEIYEHEQNPDAPPDETAERQGDLVVEELASYPRERWLVEKTYLQKLSIVAAGPIANILFALIASIILIWSVGAPVYDPSPVVGSLVKDYPAEKAGIQEGDLILKVAGTEVKTWAEMAKNIAAQEGASFELVLLRKNEEGIEKKIELQIAGQYPDAERKVLNETLGTKPRYQIGIGPAQQARRPVGILEGILSGFEGIWFTTKITLVGLWKVITTEISAENLGGPVMIISEGMKATEAGVAPVVDFCIFLSMSLAILNLFPIPVLDGGHITIFTIEKIRGKKLGFKTLLFLHQLGFLLLLSLMVFATKNDIMRLISS